MTIYPLTIQQHRHKVASDQFCMTWSFQRTPITRRGKRATFGKVQLIWSHITPWPRVLVLTLPNWWSNAQACLTTIRALSRRIEIPDVGESSPVAFIAKRTRSSCKGHDHYRCFAARSSATRWYLQIRNGWSKKCFLIWMNYSKQEDAAHRCEVTPSFGCHRTPHNRKQWPLATFSATCCERHQDEAFSLRVAEASPSDRFT
jgi:hypothetical protein